MKLQALFVENLEDIKRAESMDMAGPPPEYEWGELLLSRDCIEAAWLNDDKHINIVTKSGMEWTVQNLNNLYGELHRVTL